MYYVSHLGIDKLRGRPDTIAEWGINVAVLCQRKLTTSDTRKFRHAPIKWFGPCPAGVLSHSEFSDPDDVPSITLFGHLEVVDGHHPPDHRNSRVELTLGPAQATMVDSLRPQDQTAAGSLQSIGEPNSPGHTVTVVDAAPFASLHSHSTSFPSLKILALPGCRAGTHTEAAARGAGAEDLRAAGSVRAGPFGVCLYPVEGLDDVLPPLESSLF